jgi:hypothetical protein
MTPECPTKLKTILIGTDFYNTLIYYNNLPLRHFLSSSDFIHGVLFCLSGNDTTTGTNNITLLWDGTTWIIYGYIGNFITIN